MVGRTCILLAGATLVANTLGVTITLSGPDPGCNSIVSVVCTSIAPATCCNIPNAGTFAGALFQGLPTTAQGIVYSGTAGCTGTSTDAGNGLSLCLGGGSGAEWDQPGSRIKRAVDKKPCNGTALSELHVGGRMFSLTKGPTNVREEMLAFFQNSASHEGTVDVPEAFLPYELA